MTSHLNIDQFPDFETQPLTPDRWADLEALFGERGAVGGCWCMWWRLKRSQFEQNKGEANKLAFREVVRAGDPPGLLAYVAGRPIAWCAIAPRKMHPALDHSRILKRVDDQPVWSIVCLFIPKPYRRQGLSVRLIWAAVAYALSRGARIIEAYPVEPRQDSMPAVFAWTGFAAAYRQAGFVEVLRRSETRPIMRYEAGSRANAGPAGSGDQSQPDR